MPEEDCYGHTDGGGQGLSWLDVWFCVWLQGDFGK